MYNTFKFRLTTLIQNNRIIEYRSGFLIILELPVNDCCDRGFEFCDNACDDWLDGSTNFCFVLLDWEGNGCGWTGLLDCFIFYPYMFRAYSKNKYLMKINKSTFTLIINLDVITELLGVDVVYKIACKTKS